jgi:carboxynorspermidine decarboxylase
LINVESRFIFWSFIPLTDLTQRTDIPSPCYVLEEAKLIKNLELMKRVQDDSGARSNGQFGLGSETCCRDG